MPKRLGYDAPKHSRDEATELCVYHLRMAAALFQLVPDDDNESIDVEIDRQCEDGIDDVEIKPAKTWARLMLEAYEAMKDRD